MWKGGGGDGGGQGSRRGMMNRTFPVRALLLLALLLAPAGCGRLGFFNAVIPKDSGSRLAARDVSYGSDPRQTLDVYVPAGAPSQRRGVLVFLYGGSWSSGSRRDYAFAGRAFAAQGFVTVVPDYRLVPEIRYPGFVEDSAKAVAWAYRHAEKFGGDSTAGLFLVGHSAGAYNAVMVAAAPEFLGAEGLSPGIIRAVAGLSGPYEFVPLAQVETRDAFMGVANLSRTQPIGRLRRGSHVPPMLLVHGEADDFVRPSNSKNLAAALRRTGHEAALKLYPGVGHRGTLLSLAKPLRGQAPVLDDVVEFFARH